MLIALLVMTAGASLLIAKDLAVSFAGLILVIVGSALMVAGGSNLWEALGCAAILIVLAIALLWKGNSTPSHPTQPQTSPEDQS